MNFNPRAPCGARLSRTYSLTRAPVISTHAPLAGRDALVLDGALVEHRISTHAPLAGRDNLIKGVNVTIGISTHAPLAGRDAGGKTASCGELIFQPTRPLRGATRKKVLFSASVTNFNPRAPCGARRSGRGCTGAVLPISTHAPLAGRDLFPYLLGTGGIIISTHAPLAGRDGCANRNNRRTKYFNPRAPCGARPGVPAHT